MELLHKVSNKLEPQDFIGNMPDNVVTNIMDRLPLEVAVRTGILARNWRFKWTLLSQLVFDQDFFEYLLKRNVENNHAKLISRILLHHGGAITKFVLYIDDDYPVLDGEDISHWILCLSRKGIKDLTIKNRGGTPLKLPTHLFSCLELKHLKLYNCHFHPLASFHGFPNLLSLELCVVALESGELGEFITRCPLLEILNLCKFWSIGNVKLVEIAKLENLKILSFPMCDLDPMITSSSTIFELVGSLPKLQELDLDFVDCKLTESGVIKRFPVTFPCIKALKLSKIDLKGDIMLSCFIEMVRSFPNLQTLEIIACDAFETPAICFPEIDYNTMGLLQLRNVVFTVSEASENEVCLIKYLLACSPILKKIVIHCEDSLESSDEKLMLAKKLLKLHRASTTVEIDLY